MARKHWLIIIAILICCTAPVWAATSEYPGRIFSQSQIGTINPAWVPESLAVSPDGQQIAYVAIAGDKQYVVYNNSPGKEYDEILNKQLIFSPRGNHLAYIAKNAGKYIVIADGWESKAYEALFDASFQFNSDGSQFVYIAKNNNKWMVVKNEKEGKAYDAISAATLAISGDGKRLAYAAFNGSKWFPVIDGVEGNLYDTIRSLILSPDGQRVAFVARTGENFAVIIDNTAGQSYPMIKAASLVFSPDSQRLAYVVEDGASQFAVIDNIAGKPYEYIGSSGITFSPDSKRFVYPGLMNGQWFMVVDGNEGKLYEGLMRNKPIFSPNSQRLAYFAKRADSWFLVLDGIERKPYVSVGSSSFIFAPNNRDYAYVAKVPCGWAVVTSGEENRCYQAIALQSLTYSPEGSHFAYNAYRGDKWVVVLDGHEGRQFDSILLGERKIPFRNPVSFSYLALEANQLLLVNEQTFGQLGREIKFVFNPPDGTQFVVTTKTTTTIDSAVTGKITSEIISKTEVSIKKTRAGFTIAKKFLEFNATTDGTAQYEELNRVYKDIVLFMEIDNNGNLLNVSGLDKIEKRFKAIVPKEKQASMANFVSEKKLLAEIQRQWQDSIQKYSGRTFRVGESWKETILDPMPSGKDFELNATYKISDELTYAERSCIRVRAYYSIRPELIKELLAGNEALKMPDGNTANMNFDFSGEGESIVEPATMLNFMDRATFSTVITLEVPGSGKLQMVMRQNLENTYVFKR